MGFLSSKENSYIYFKNNWLMNKALQKYYWDVNSINFPISITFGYFFGIVWGALIFSSFGLLISLISYRYLRNNEYYLYHNLGYSKLKLMRTIFLLNLAISLPLLLLSILLGK